MFPSSYPSHGSSQSFAGHEYAPTENDFGHYSDGDDNGHDDFSRIRVPRLSAAQATGASPPSPRRPPPKQNARSFYHSYRHHEVDDVLLNSTPHYSSSAVRDQTAQLANLALAEVASLTGGTAALSPGPQSSPRIRPLTRSQGGGGPVEHDGSFPRSRVLPILRSPPPKDPDGGEHMSPISSYLTTMFRKHHSEHQSSHPERTDDSLRGYNERDPLLPKHGDTNRTQYTHHHHPAASHDDLEHQRRRPSVNSSNFRLLEGSGVLRRFCDQKLWTRKEMWEKVVREPASYLPSVVLGLLLNVLDGLSYGMILFPLGQDIFSDLGPDGLSMFYVSCIVSQLVFSCGGSVFKGGIGSEMIEVVPFFHKMAFTILNHVGSDNPKSVIATTITSYAISSVLTGAVFFCLGTLKLGSLIGFFPRSVLVGCIGGVGWFLIATGIEVSARLDGNLNYDLETLSFLVDPKTLMLWVVPLLLAGLLVIFQRCIKSPLFMPLYFMSMPVVFYMVVGIAGVDLSILRAEGWVFEAPVGNVPFWHFYTLYDFHAINWDALMKTVPAMFALTFFGILHVPINVPALGVSTGEDNVDVDRELIAHGISNALSGFAGSIQNYLVYSNSILFIRSGGDSRIAGVMLAIGTFGIMVAGPSVIGYIPIMVVGALIFLLGIELMKEALWDTWGKLSKLEYLTICTIVVTMGAWDFVIGILIGVVLACVSLVVQTSRKSSIRATYTGAVVRSTVRRHPIQQRFLDQVGRQTYVIKLSGYMFFGTISSVEGFVRELLADNNFAHQPIRFLIIDLLHVIGMDFSAAEAFTRMRRLLLARNVEMILSGVTPRGDIANSLRAVGVWTDDTVLVFDDLNAALESCENEFLRALYAHRDEASQQKHNPPPRSLTFLDVPRVPPAHSGIDDINNHLGSPRRALVHAAATTTLKSDEVVQSSKWQSFKQPLPLLLQTFQEMTEKNEDYWFRVLPFFEKRTYPMGSVLFRPGDQSQEFYLIEEGILRAEYDAESGKYSESIVAGTTCGELPFFSNTQRTATVTAEKDTIAWVLTRENWEKLQEKYPDAAKELLTISLKLTTERLHAITKYIYVGT